MYHKYIYLTADGIIPIKREARKRKPNRRYSSSDGLSDSGEPHTGVSKNDPHNDFEMQEDQSIEALELQLRKQTEASVEVDPSVAKSKSVQQMRADNLLNSDVSTKPLNGFRESDLKHDHEVKQRLENYLAKADEDLELNVSCDESEIDDSCLPPDFYAKRDFIYLSDLNQKSLPPGWRGPKKVAALLKKMFGGNPKVIHPVPRWLLLKVRVKSGGRYIYTMFDFKFNDRSPLSLLR